MPRLVHRQITTIQIVSVEVTWADEDDAPATESSTLVRHRRRVRNELKDVQNEEALDATSVPLDDKP
ncbi:MAG: hypothetical protein HY869_20205 [Chloroflexi bacterium]|nr:hypothetical protein [Chloroflexota bacterium]